MKRLTIGILMLALVLPVAAVKAEEQAGMAQERIETDTVWKSEVLVEKQLTVAEGARLTVEPGAVVRFGKGAGLKVEGVLEAKGTSGAPVTFTSADPEPVRGCWAGISLASSGEGTIMEHCRVEYASSLSVNACSPDIRDCELTNGLQGIALARKSTSAIERNRILDMDDSGINCQMGAAPTITGNTVERCGQFGIVSNQDAQPDIKGNVISGCEVGIRLTRPVPPVEDNTLKANKTGIMLSSCDRNLVISGNRFIENEDGLVCQQFSSPLVEKNLIKGNKQGLVCFMSSSPLIRRNTVSGNDKGILCIQLCNPEITANDISGNHKGIYLDLSSYAVVNGNNIYDNDVQLELGNMSSDWEYRVRKKPIRGAQAQNLTKANRGQAVRQAIEDTAEVMGYVDARGNWWGEPVTGEMVSKGPDANIESFVDYYDVPVRTYEGYEGEYIQDRIEYEGWKSARIKDAGM